MSTSLLSVQATHGTVNQHSAERTECHRLTCDDESEDNKQRQDLCLWNSLNLPQHQVNREQIYGCQSGSHPINCANDWVLDGAQEPVPADCEEQGEAQPKNAQPILPIQLAGYSIHSSVQVLVRPL